MTTQCQTDNHVGTCCHLSWQLVLQRTAQRMPPGAASAHQYTQLQTSTWSAAIRLAGSKSFEPQHGTCSTQRASARARHHVGGPPSHEQKAAHARASSTTLLPNPSAAVSQSPTGPAPSLVAATAGQCSWTLPTQCTRPCAAAQVDSAAGHQQCQPFNTTSGH